MVTREEELPAAFQRTRALLVRIGVVAALAIGIASPASSEVVTLESARDNTLFEDAQGDTSNGAGPAVFTGRNSQGRARRALLYFDVRAAIPPTATIHSASLTLYLSSSSDPETRALAVHRALASWGEGASASGGGSGAPAQIGDATWLHRFYPGDAWIQPGGDWAPGPSATTLVDATTGDYEWTGAGLVADVRWWLESGEEHGWILIGDETAAGTARRFDSREVSASATRPRLTLEFSTSTPAGRDTWGGLKQRYQ